jgi:hypothetical protein
MPHYQDGTEAKRGDIVRGKGYNHSYPVQGVVLNVAPGAETCNLTVGIARGAVFPVDPKAVYNGNIDVARVSSLVQLEDGRLLPVELIQEYGTCADFELIHRPEPQPNGSML